MRGCATWRDGDSRGGGLPRFLGRPNDIASVRTEVQAVGALLQCAAVRGYSCIYTYIHIRPCVCRLGRLCAVCGVGVAARRGLLLGPRCVVRCCRSTMAAVMLICLLLLAPCRGQSAVYLGHAKAAEIAEPLVAKVMGWGQDSTRAAANLPPRKSDDNSGSSEVMNGTDLRMPTLINFNLEQPLTDAQGIATCSAYCTKHSSTCGGWVYVSPFYLPRSHYTGPRCSIKGKGPCYTAPGHPGLFSGALSGSCSLPPPRPPPGPPSPPHPPPKPHGRADPFYSHFHVQAMKHSTYDPDGPVFFNSSSDPEGTYHVFAQYNPTTPRSAHDLGSGAYSAMQWYHW